MNDRIQELALQAGVTGYFAGGTDLATPIPMTPELQKFAELMVKECCDMVNSHVQHNNPNDSLLALKIKEHFGVDE